MSWLAAARKRVFETLASSASPLARPSSVLRRVNSSVRSCTRRSSDSLARSSSSAVCTLLHDQIALVKTFEKRLTACDVTRKPFAHERIGGVLVRNALFGVEAQDLVEAGAEPSELRWQCEDLAELAIPADEVQLL